jgi:hypothetical protein
MQMNVAFKRIGVYARLAVMAAVAISIAIVFYSNRSNDTDVWLFHHFPKVNVVWVMLVTAGVTVVFCWILSRIRGVIRDVRQMRAENRERKYEQERQRRAQELSEQEQRIDQKIQRALSEKAKNP